MNPEVPLHSVVPSGLLLALAVVASPLAAQAGVDAVDRAVAAYEDMRSFRATFEQRLENPLTGSTLRSRGEFLRRQPNLVAIRFVDPAGDRIVIDGKAVWLYLPSSNPKQAYRMPLGSAAAGTFDPAQLMAEPRKRFDISDSGVEMLDGRSTRVLTLVPKASNGSAPFTSAKVWIDAKDALIRQFEVTESTGLTRHIKLLSLEPNASVERSAFRFTPPKGVEVIDRTGGT